MEYKNCRPDGTLSSTLLELLRQKLVFCSSEYFYCTSYLLTLPASFCFWYLLSMLVSPFVPLNFIFVIAFSSLYQVLHTLIISPLCGRVLVNLPVILSHKAENNQGFPTQIHLDVTNTSFIPLQLFIYQKVVNCIDEQVRACSHAFVSYKYPHNQTSSVNIIISAQ